MECDRRNNRSALFWGATGCDPHHRPLGRVHDQRRQEARSADRMAASRKAHPRGRGCADRQPGARAGPYSAMAAFAKLAEGVAQDLRANRFDAILMQRSKKVRNGVTAMRYTTKTINMRPNIPRMIVNVGECSSTNIAGTDVTIAKIVSPIQSSIFSIRSKGFRADYISIKRLGLHVPPTLVARADEMIE
jgi:hypothetical protein